MNIEVELAEIKRLLLEMRDQQTVKDWYSVEEFARLVGKAEFTVREWARLGRVKAKKWGSGRGAHAQWCFEHSELCRYRMAGLLPDRSSDPRIPR